MNKMKRHATYQIDLEKQDPDYDESAWWTWKLSLAGTFVHYGTGGYRWTALRKAKKAARRHIRGKVIEKVKAPKPNTVFYAIEARR